MPNNNTNYWALYVESGTTKSSGFSLRKSELTVLKTCLQRITNNLETLITFI